MLGLEYFAISLILSWCIVNVDYHHGIQQIPCILWGMALIVLGQVRYFMYWFIFKKSVDLERQIVYWYQRLTNGPGTILLKVLLFNPTNCRGRQILERQILIWQSWFSSYWYGFNSFIHLAGYEREWGVLDYIFGSCSLLKLHFNIVSQKSN